jgi:RNA polymerase sigma-B factor
MQELHLAVSRTSDTLTQHLGRSPTVADLAQDLEVTEEEILCVLECGRAYNTLPLDAPAPRVDIGPACRVDAASRSARQSGNVAHRGSANQRQG